MVAITAPDKVGVVAGVFQRHGEAVVRLGEVIDDPAHSVRYLNRLALN
jgi:hypothetical protein